jgi:hypothetical protein
MADAATAPEVVADAAAPAAAAAADDKEIILDEAGQPISKRCVSGARRSRPRALTDRCATAPTAPGC